MTTRELSKALAKIKDATVKLRDKDGSLVDVKGVTLILPGEDMFVVLNAKDSTS